MENSTTGVGESGLTVRTNVSLTSTLIIYVNRSTMRAGNASITPTETVENLCTVLGDLNDVKFHNVTL